MAAPAVEEVVLRVCEKQAAKVYRAEQGMWKQERLYNANVEGSEKYYKHREAVWYRFSHLL